MFKGSKIVQVHARFLQSCRNLKEGRAYWSQASPFRRWLLERILPVPLLSLDNEGKPLYEALQWLEKNCRSEPFNEETIAMYHQLLFAGKRPDAGQFRKHGVSSIGGNSPFPPPEKVPLLLKQLMTKYPRQATHSGPLSASDAEGVLDMSLRLYQRIGWIHPFGDGNGRVARLAMNHWQRYHNQGYILFPPISEKPSLLEALSKADRGDCSHLKELARQYSLTK
jgi:fido (protein-threonine AMPylation protein)